jgi:hypothetical protein
MDIVLSIFDNFLPEGWCEKLRNEVLADGFTTEMVEEAKGHPPTPYYTVNMKRDMTEFFSHVEAALAQNIKPEMGAFRLGEDKSHLHNFVHADHTCADLACVYYLNRPRHCQGGTAFWKHRRFGWISMPTQEQIEKVGYSLDELKEDWMDPNAWDMVTLAGMQTNRLIIYPTAMFHSRWPWQGFGTKPENSRLIFAGFFSIK